ncbi:MAG TPA: hypothetical protein VMQ86_00615 [Bryobacteraceae bacterium]|jgi:uncharacterized membrane protein|nr:hypothetical protein [Bryobacteraceae bacterium]
MSNATRAFLLVITFLGGLAVFAWVISDMGGYHFGPTLLAVVDIYVMVLLMYACFRRITQKVRVARAQKSLDTALAYPPRFV